MTWCVDGGKTSCHVFHIDWKHLCIETYRSLVYTESTLCCPTRPDLWLLTVAMQFPIETTLNWSRKCSENASSIVTAQDYYVMATLNIQVRSIGVECKWFQKPSGQVGSESMISPTGFWWRATNRVNFNKLIMRIIPWWWRFQPKFRVHGWCWGIVSGEGRNDPLYQVVQSSRLALVVRVPFYKCKYVLCRCEDASCCQRFTIANFPLVHSLNVTSFGYCNGTKKKTATRYIYSHW